MYGCYFINFDYTKWFETKEEAKNHGKNSTFQFKIIYDKL